MRLSKSTVHDQVIYELLTDHGEVVIGVRHNIGSTMFLERKTYAYDNLFTEDSLCASLGKVRVGHEGTDLYIENIATWIRPFLVVGLALLVPSNWFGTWQSYLVGGIVTFTIGFVINYFDEFYTGILFGKKKRSKSVVDANGELVRVMVGKNSKVRQWVANYLRDGELIIYDGLISNGSLMFVYMSLMKAQKVLSPGMLIIYIPYKDVLYGIPCILKETESGLTESESIYFKGNRLGIKAEKVAVTYGRPRRRKHSVVLNQIRITTSSKVVRRFCDSFENEFLFHSSDEVTSKELKSAIRVMEATVVSVQPEA